MDAGTSGLVGGPGLVAVDCDLVLAGGSVAGGTGGITSFGELPRSDGGVGLDLAWSLASARATLIRGGSSGTDGVDGKDVVAVHSTLVYDGNCVSPPCDVDESDGQLIVATPPPPFLFVRGGDGPGQDRELELYGPPGALALVATSSSPGLSTPPHVEGAVWIGSPLLQLSAFVTAGFDSPVGTTWTLASTPGLEGVVLRVQGYHPFVRGVLDRSSRAVTNPGNVIVRL